MAEDSQTRGTETPVLAEVEPDTPVMAEVEPGPVFESDTPVMAEPEPVVEVAEDESPPIDDDSPRIGDDPTGIGEDLDDTLIQEIESRLAEELSREDGTKRYRGQKVELDKADLELEIDLPPEAETEDELPAAPAAPEAPQAEAGAWWTRWPVLVAAGITAAVLGGGLICSLRQPPPVSTNVRTIWRGRISGHESLQLALQPFFVPIKGTPARRLKVVLVIVLSDFRTRDHFRRWSPSLVACRNAVYQILSRKTIEELTLNREELQNQIRARLNQIISSGKVTQVHFTQFLVSWVRGKVHA